MTGEPAAGSGLERVPDEWQARIDDHVARGQQSRAIELLEVWVTQFALTPWAFARLGQLHFEAGNRDKAGWAFFWTGERGDAERQRCIDGWLKAQRRAPKRIVRSLSQRARVPVAQMPGALPAELAALKVTDSVSVTANKNLPPWLDWALVALVLWFLGVGVVMTFRWVLEGIAALRG